jgi:hypothetical protein
LVSKSGYGDATAPLVAPTPARVTARLEAADGAGGVRAAVMAVILGQQLFSLMAWWRLRRW